MKAATCRFTSILIGLTLYGCTTDAVITRRSQMSDPLETGDLIILMKDGTRYDLNNYRLTDSLLVGAGFQGVAGTAFRGELKLKEISHICSRNSSFFKSLVAIGVVAGFVGLSASYLDRRSGLQVNEVDGYYSPYRGGGTMSCPFIYSWDGTKYRFQSETFAGAVFKGAERASFDILDGLRPVEGIYKLRITNERPEIEYTNEMRLFAIDCVQGANVLTDARGGMHTVSNPLLPEKCSDFQGRDVTDKIAMADGVFWESDLTDKDFTHKEDLKDGLILDFKKPAGLMWAKLVVRGINTNLGGFAFAQLFGLRGPNFLELYKQLETDTSMGKRMLSFMKREGMLHVSVWKGDRWVELGALPDVGPLISKEQLVLLNVGDIGGEVIKIKLESSTDLWRLDRVAIDFSKDLPLSVQEAPLVSALDESGQSVAGQLRVDDDQYYVTTPGQFADLSFGEIPPAKGMSRTFIVKARGYYHIWASPGKTDRGDIVERILREPLYGSMRYMPAWKEARGRRM